MNTYLIISETIYFMQNTLNTLKNGIDNVVSFNLQENTLSEVLEEASYLSMFNDQKCIIVKNAQIFASNKGVESKKYKEDADKLLKYLDNENKNVKLIFVLNGKADSKKKIYSILNEHNNVYIEKKLTKTDIKNELNNIVKDNGYTIEDKSLWYIINNSLGNLDLCVNELNKLFIYYSKKCVIKYEDVIALTSKGIEENNFKLVDSIINKNLEESLKNLKEAQIFKIEPSVIIALLYREFRLMLSVKLYEEARLKPIEIMSNLKLADWQLQKVKANLQMYNKDEIKTQIIKLGDIDYQYKSGLINKDVVLITYILNLCM